MELETFLGSMILAVMDIASVFYWKNSFRKITFYINGEF